MTHYLAEFVKRTLGAYESQPVLLDEHVGIELEVLAGGYGYRQILELVQNGADAILEAHEGGQPPAQCRIHVLAHESSLYVANTGAPLSKNGLRALLSSHYSPKRGNQIGRFGLGFKSLLRLGGRIDLFTKASGAFRFDPDRCRRELKARFGVQEAPGLRMAWPLEDSERDRDAILDRLSWAETVVRVEVLAEDIFKHLRHEILTFPAEFLLFFPISTLLTLEDGESPERELQIEIDGGDRLLHDGSESSRWRVAQIDISITDPRAIADATRIHARDKVPLAWAIPLEGKREESGRFWAFFPTRTPTYMPGILNAPWKLNSDRNAIIGGEWNKALMIEAADLIVSTLESLSTSEDPGRPLDAFPRQLDRKDEDAAPLVEAIWGALERAPVIADAAGTLRTAKELMRHPRDNAELAQQWQMLADPDHFARLVHPSCLERQRSSRLNSLAERLNVAGMQPQSTSNLCRCSEKSWFESVASTEIPQALRVLKLAEAYANDCAQNQWNLIRATLAIIPSEDGQLVNAAQAIFAPAGANVPDRASVASALCDDAEAKRVLVDVMKVKELDDRLWESLLSNSLGTWLLPGKEYDAAWRLFWDKLRAAPDNVRNQFAKRHCNQICVCRRDGSWVPPDAVLLPGELVRNDDVSSNRAVLTEHSVHSEDGELLAVLGVREFPEGNIDPGDYRYVVTRYVDDREKLLSDWLHDCRSAYRREHDNSASWSYLEPTTFYMPKGYAILPKLGGTPNVKLTKAFLSRIAQGHCISRVRFGHSTVAKYPLIDVPNPFPWFVLRHGVVEVGDNMVRLADIVSRRAESALAMIPDWEQLQPAIEVLGQYEKGITSTDGSIRALWAALIDAYATPPAIRDDSLRDLWAGAARDGVVPESIHTESEEISIEEVYVTNSPDLAHRARTRGRVVVLLDEAALTLWLSKGARNLSELIKPNWANTSGPLDLLITAVPDVAEVLTSDAKESARCQPVTELKLQIDDRPEPVSCLMWDDTLLLDTEQMSKLARTERMRLLIAEITAAEWLDCSPEEALERLGNAGVDQLRADVAAEATLATRLWRAVGKRREPLHVALGDLGHMDFIQRCEPFELTELTLAQLGPATLSILRDTLEAEGLKPPRRWNTSEARAFVASIGFPEEYAASAEMRRDAEEYISGPIELPPLHDFQIEVLEGIRGLVADGTGRRRAVVSLPTGGGKTRVTVEAAVQLVLEPEGDQRSVIWIAQTDELCEQAVQAFRQVWINVGAQRTDLRIVRLWGGNPNPAIQEPDKPIVVIASIQTLNSRMGTNGLAWLQNPGLVVVDECHHAITPSYTNLLRWLDAEAPRTKVQEPKEEPPIIGLSATPFRTDDEESQRLAKRFDNRWFPPDQADLHVRLLSQGVLAQANYVALESGIGLLPDELERLQKLSEPWEGFEFEKILEAINQRLAGDMQRNERLIDCIQKSDEHSILFFSNSVLHAEEMAARLHLAGISAAAVSGQTPTVSRRCFLDRFQRGEIRVLCNHSVLSTGFDAPKTDMVLIARQVFSPVRYMQMVGRGLRGEKNGGTARCRIVTVVDNLGRFQERHPYHYCERYFQSQLQMAGGA